MRMGNNIFCWQRFWALTLNTLRKERKTMILFAVTVGLILFLLPLGIMYACRFWGYFWDSFPGNYFVVVSFLLIYASMIAKGVNCFPEIKDRQKASAFISLPASVLEKTLSRYLLFSFGLFIFAALICYIFSMLSYFWLGSYTNIEACKLNSIDFSKLLQFFNVQAIFLIGGLYFRKNSFVKTTLVLILFIVMMNGGFSYLFSNDFWGWFRSGYFNKSVLWDSISGIIFYIIYLSIIYFRLKELEIHEV